MGGSCSTHGAKSEMYTKVWSENIKGRDHSEDICVDGRIISELNLKK